MILFNRSNSPKIYKLFNLGLFMSRVDKVFGKFMDLNGISSRPDFAAKTVVYDWGDKGPFTRKELEETYEFSGFVDGFEGNKNRALAGPGNTLLKKIDLSQFGIGTSCESSGNGYEAQYKLAQFVDKT